ncbi:hypothetical protein QJS04_geneDACA017037 [Acorus gramineus]|uniref:Transcription repressor n=1 Tax=Acorus gramineus TaxID=55184 RepID=A0AAV9AJW9_ACOGR|nr:hypothetical protein QJS04_geneDACA017037 [Acorus gramineus]
MGNYRFRLSDMIPNAWFYKLKYMTTTTTHNNKNPSKHKPPLSSTPKPLFSPPPNHHHQPHRPSYYYSTSASPLPDPPRRSKRKPRRRSTTTKTSDAAVSAGCTCKTVWDKADPDPLSHPSPDSRADERLLHQPRPGQDDVNFDYYDDDARDCMVIDVDREELMQAQEQPASGFGLRPVSTRPTPEKSSLCKTQTGRRSFGGTPTAAGVKLRALSGSPRVKVNTPHRRSSAAVGRRRRSEGLAVVKASTDPQRDFRESMVEMIVENNIRASKDLEELLACYLSLNSDEYHDVIVNVFQQIWFDLTDVRL